MNVELENIKEKNSKKKKHYSEPKVTALGAMQRLTLGGSNPDADSGPGVGPGDQN